MNRRWLLAAASLASMASCADAVDDRSVDLDSASIRVAVAHAGGADTIVLAPFRAPEEFGLQFTTYVPSDMSVRASDGDEDFVRFEPAGTTAFSARTTFIHIVVHPSGTTSQRAQNVVETFAASRGVPVSESENATAPYSEDGVPPEAGTLIPARFEWALLEVPYAYNCVVVTVDCQIGRIALGHHRDRYFHVVVQYPPHAASFMRPRIAEIFKRWRWVEIR